MTPPAVALSGGEHADGAADNVLDVIGPVLAGYAAFPLGCPSPDGGTESGGNHKPRWVDRIGHCIGRSLPAQ